MVFLQPVFPSYAEKDKKNIFSMKGPRNLNWLVFYHTSILYSTWLLFTNT